MTWYRSPKMPQAWARMEWCRQMFGPSADDQTEQEQHEVRWNRVRGFLFFKHESDFVLYMLRWT